jgi:hypothetical protein
MTANCQTGLIVIAECYHVNPTFIRALNEKVDENTVNEKQISFFKKVIFVSLRSAVSTAELVCHSSTI